MLASHNGFTFTIKVVKIWIVYVHSSKNWLISLYDIESILEWKIPMTMLLQSCLFFIFSIVIKHSFITTIGIHWLTYSNIDKINFNIMYDFIIIWSMIIFCFHSEWKNTVKLNVIYIFLAKSQTFRLRFLFYFIEWKKKNSRMIKCLFSQFEWNLFFSLILWIIAKEKIFSGFRSGNFSTKAIVSKWLFSLNHCYLRWRWHWWCCCSIKF